MHLSLLPDHHSLCNEFMKAYRGMKDHEVDIAVSAMISLCKEFIDSPTGGFFEALSEDQKDIYKAIDRHFNQSFIKLKKHSANRQLTLIHLCQTSAWWQVISFFCILTGKPLRLVIPVL